MLRHHFSLIKKQKYVNSHLVAEISKNFPNLLNKRLKKYICKSKLNFFKYELECR